MPPPCYVPGGFMRGLAVCCALMVLAMNALAQTNNNEISGQMLDTSSNPVSHAKATAFGVLLHDGVEDLVPYCDTVTDQQGRFSCSALPDGTYVVQASEAEPGRATGPRQEIYEAAPAAEKAAPSPPLNAVFGRRFYPNTPALIEASRLKLKSGAQIVANFTLQRIAGNSLVVVPPPTAPPNLRMRVSEDGGLPVSVMTQVAFNQAANSYTMKGLPQSELLVEADWFADGYEHHANAVARATSQGSRVLLSEIKSSMITGTVVWNENDKRAPSVTLERLSAKGKWVASAQVTGATHEFTFKDLPDGTYALSAHGGGKSMSSVRLKGGPTVQNITLSETGQHVTVELEMSAASSSVRGRVDSLGQRDFAKARIILRSSGGRLAVAPLSRDGSFDLGEQSPGDYLLYGLADADLLPYRNLEILNRMKEAALPISVRPGAPESIAVRLYDAPAGL